ncbi:hypothetical protein A8C56_07615 [Niabella ginsenosidivorans]|uniref:Uncharacterized protein n=1 Tax=Niabella ginsenosidivorans TaxID=1176587 RepID=A0A1A9I024_9BACT|nr:hypothetical protein [Niabella ginsenosidivorans]ANH80863.1 hypothetical protein A8C56_07615 [Niabella ginsenosidivorans]
MRAKTHLLAIVLLTIVACNNNHVQHQPVADVPKALEDNNNSYKLISKRSTGDLVENLYSELISKNKNLEQLEAGLDTLSQSRVDSTDPFNQFNQKVLSYYNAADQHINHIADSLLRDKIRNLVESYLAKYVATTAKHNELLKTINAKNVKLSDLHTVLKIVKTLPQIERYQKENLPGTLSLEGYIKKQDEAIKKEDQMMDQ